jgi:hypothetical protein
MSETAVQSSANGASGPRAAMTGMIPGSLRGQQEGLT